MTQSPPPNIRRADALTRSVIDPERAVIDLARQPLAELLERDGIEATRGPLGHRRTTGGGLHRGALDIRRRPALEPCT